MKASSPPISVEGTLDLVTPAEIMPPGRFIQAKNYEPVMRGARRFSGFERYDGRPKPSDQSYWILNFDAGTAAVAAAATVTGATSGATGIAVLASVVSTGTFGSSNAAGYLVLRQVTGTFVDNENLQVSAVTKCVANGAATEMGADNDTTLTAQYLQGAIEAARTLIQKPTGAGSILGVWKFKGVRYCFRNNAGGTAAGLWKATTTGWQAVSLGTRVAFTSGGTYEISEGDTITGATSSATAVVRRINLVGVGDWASGTAAGYLILSGQVGTFGAENLNVGVNNNVATIAANATAQTLAADGKYRFVTHNFYGAANRVRMYGVNGVNQAFDFDGTYFALIATGMTVDTPSHIGAFKNQLILGFPGGSVQTSSIGLPADWDALTGASELGVGADLTCLLSGWADCLVIASRSQMKILNGNDSNDFVLDDTNSYAGAYQDTMQLVSLPVYLDDTGIRNLIPSQAILGNFNLGTLSLLVEPYLAAQRKDGVSPICSVVSKRRDQYRLFFDDGTALFVFFGRKTRGGQPWILPISLGVNITCVCSTICVTGEDANEEVVLFGADNGYVYEMDVGTSFDGAEVEAYARFPYNNLGSPTRKKAWKEATVALDAAPTATLLGSAEFGGGDPDQRGVPAREAAIAGGGGYYNIDRYSRIYYSSPTIGRGTFRIEGVGVDCSVALYSSQAYEEAHTIHGLTLHYAPRGLTR